MGRSAHPGWCVYDAETRTYRDIAPAHTGWRLPSRARLITGAALPASVLAVGLLLVALWSSLPSRAQTMQRAHTLHLTLEKRADGSLEPAEDFLQYSLDTPLERLPAHLKDAVLATEDRLLYSPSHVHYLFYKSATAVMSCAGRFLLRGSIAGCTGNSTITQQVAKLLWVEQDVRTPYRKLREWLWTLKMEWQLTPDEILQIYLNRVPLGRGTRGVEQAARHHFGKSAHQLDLSESVLLVAALNRPRDNITRAPAAAIARADVILDAMFRYGFLNDNRRLPEHLRLPSPASRPARPYLKHYARWVMPEARRALAKAPPGRYKLYTHASPQVHGHAEAALRRTLGSLQESGVPAREGAVMVMRTDGRVLAMLGGAGSDRVSRGINRSVPIRHLHCPPAASVLKPIVYTVALNAGLRPDTLIDASPIDLALPSGSRYRPGNHGGVVHGQVTLREGLGRSINTAAIRLAMQPGAMHRWRAVAERFGLSDADMGFQLGDAIGQSEVCLIDLMRLYAIIATRGRDVVPSGIHAIVDENGREVLEHRARVGPRRHRRRVMQTLHSLLVDAVRTGTGKRAGAGLEAMDIAGKTGTADDNTDASFVGYTDELVIGVWIGNDRPVPMPGVTGGTAPAQVFNELLHELRRHTTLLPYRLDP